MAKYLRNSLKSGKGVLLNQMVNVSKMTDVQIREAALSIISKELGPVGLLRFLRQYETGYGDYTKDREELLKDVTMESIVAGIKARRKEQ